MPTFVYRCAQCDRRIEISRRLVDGARHMDGNDVCGTLARDYRAENVMMNRVPGGGRESR